MDTSRIAVIKPYTDVESVVPFIPEVIVERLIEDAKLPTYATEGDSGMDFYSPEDLVIRPGERKLIKLGITMGIPKHPFHSLGYRWEMQIRSKSGVSARTKLMLILSTIDNFYRDEIGVIVHNDARPVAETSFLVTNLQGTSMSVKELPDMPKHGWHKVYAYSGIEDGTIFIAKGAKCAQGVLNEIVRPLKITEGKVDRAVHRGGGFGSTGA